MLQHALAALVALVLALARGPGATRATATARHRFALATCFGASNGLQRTNGLQPANGFQAANALQRANGLQAALAVLVLALAAFASAPAAAQTLTISATGNNGDRDTTWPGLQVDEGDTVTFTMTTNNLPVGHSGVGYANSSWSGTAYNTADLRNQQGRTLDTVPANVIWTAAIIGDLTANLRYRVAADGIAEGDETITVTLDSIHVVSAPGFTIGTPSAVTVIIRGTDSAPDFGTGAVSAKSFTYGTAITEFQVPAATGGNGAITYAVSGLPAGLVFDASGTDTNGCPGTEPREICGTPTGSGGTVTVTARDADSNTASSDEDTLTFTVSVASGVTLAANPATLTEANLSGATLTVTLPSGTAFASGVSASSFELVTNPAIAGLSIGNVTGGASGATTATLTLATGAGYGFSAASTLAVQVPAAAHTGTSAIETGTVVVTPEPGIALSRTTLALEEDPTAGGGTNANVGAYTIALTADPTTASGTDCTVAIEVTSGNADVSIDTDGSPQTKIVTFAGSDWNTPQTVTVTAASDGDGVDDVATISHSRSGACSGGFFGTPTFPSVTVNVNDDETTGVVVSPATSAASRLRTTESGGTATFTVALGSEPAGDVVLDVASSDTAQGTASPAMLTFTSTNWNTAQTVTLTGVDDNPGAADGSQTYTVSLTVDTADTADAIYDAVSAVTIHAVNADDELGLAVGAVMGQASEAGGTATFTVRLVADPALATQASQSVSVSVSSRDAGEGRVSPSSLVFTAGASGTWNVDRTVTVTGVDDAIDDGDVAWDVRLDTSSAAGSDYAAVPDVNVSVTTTDDDDAPGVALSLSPTSIAEDGGTATVRAVLSRASGAVTTLTVTGVPGLYTPGTDATIVIPAGATTSTDTATIAAVDDAVHQGSVGRAVTVTATVANDRAAADGTTMTVTGAALSLTDDDEKGLVFDPEVVTAAEGGTAGYTVALRSEPTGDVAVSVVSDNADVTVSDASLTFTMSNWNEAQTVTVTAALDGDDYADTATVSHDATGGGYGGESGTVEVSVSGDAKVAVGDGAGRREYSIEGRRVMVAVEAGVPDGVEVDLAGVGSGPALTLTFRPWPAARVSEAAGGYGLGPVGSRTVVDVVASGVPAGGVRLCLPVGAGLRAARAAAARSEAGAAAQRERRWWGRREEPPGRW